MEAKRQLHQALRGLWLVIVGLLVLTVVVPGWIEAIGFEPDGGNGAAETGIVVGLALGALVCSAALRLTRTRAGVGPRD